MPPKRDYYFIRQRASEAARRSRDREFLYLNYVYSIVTVGARGVAAALPHSSRDRPSRELCRCCDRRKHITRTSATARSKDWSQRRERSNRDSTEIQSSVGLLADCVVEHSLRHLCAIPAPSQHHHKTVSKASQSHLRASPAGPRPRHAHVAAAASQSHLRASPAGPRPRHAHVAAAGCAAGSERHGGPQH